jgi:hypothetical protein
VTDITTTIAQEVVSTTVTDGSEINSAITQQLINTTIAEDGTIETTITETPIALSIVESPAIETAVTSLPIVTTISEGLPDAPSDGSTYGRKDGGWVAVTVTETDPVFSASAAAGITSTNISNWNTAYGWGNHASVGYLTAETDPVFGASVAAGITLLDIAAWNAKQDALTFPISPALGGTGVNNGINALTVPATGTAALLGVANVFTTIQTVRLSDTALAHVVIGDADTSHLDFFTPTETDDASAEYANAGGTGDRRSIIALTTNVSNTFGAVTLLLDGSLANNYYYSNQAAVDKYFLFNFGHPVKITEAKYYQSSAVAQGTWKWQGSNNGSTWTDITAEFTLGATNPQTVDLSSNTSYYIFYRLLGTAGNLSNAPYAREWEFEIANATPVNSSKIQGYVAGTSPSGFLQFNPLGGRVSVGAITTADASADVIIGASNIQSHPLVLQLSPSHTANAMELQGSDGAIKSFMVPDGSWVIGGTTRPTGNPRLAIYDNGATANNAFVLEVHGDNHDPFVAGWFNDSVSTTVPSAAYYIDNAGNFRFGTNAVNHLYFYTNGFGNIRMSVDGNGGVGIGGAFTPLAQLEVRASTTTTNAVLETARLRAHVSTASTGAANGFGVGLPFYAETATDATYQQQGLISTSWIDATNATRKAKLSLSAYDTAARLGLEIEADGSAAKIGVLGATPIVRQAHIVDADGNLADVTTKFNALLAYLENFGFIATS